MAFTEDHMRVVTTKHLREHLAAYHLRQSDRGLRLWLVKRSALQLRLTCLTEQLTILYGVKG